MKDSCYRVAIFGLFSASGLLLGSEAFFAGPVPSWLFMLQLVLPLLSICLHAVWRLGLIPALCFVLLSASIGWFFEFCGLNFGTVFGGHYSYGSLGPDLAGVPFAVLAYWFGFIYTAHCLTDSYFKPAADKALSRPFLWLAVADGLWVTAIDLFLDPVMVARGAWNWLDGGLYFNIPLGNFLGWFLVGFLASLSFRLLGFRHPACKDQHLRLVPIIGYCLIAVSLIGFSRKLGLRAEMLAGFSFMAFPLLLAIIVKNKDGLVKSLNI